MAGYVCTIAGGKGGVGKTTAAINVAAAMEEAGYDAVVVDADLGMANLATMLDATFDRSVHEVLAGESAVSDALTDVQGGVTVLPGERGLDAFADADPADLRNVVESVRNAYDVVIVDTGAGLSHETTVPLGLADGVVLVTTPDEAAVADAAKTGELADRAGGAVLGALLNRATGADDVGDVADRLGVAVLAVVPDDPGAAGAEPLVFDSPDSPPAEAYRRLAALLAEVFFEGADPDAVEPALDPGWFVDPDDDGGDGDDGRFGGLL